MSKELVISTPEELRPFFDEKGILEIVTRKKNKKFSAFQKILLSNMPQGDAKEAVKDAISLLGKNKKSDKAGMDLADNIFNKSNLSIALNGLNLCATCAGFAVMYAKLDKVSGQINQIMSVVKQEHDIQTNYEFKKVISEHANMLDCRKTQRYYTEEQMRKLVDDEYNVLEMLIDIFTHDLSNDVDNLIFSLYSLASMLAVSLKYFDEIYYYNNKNVIGNGEVWHSSHDGWMTVFDKLSSPDVMTKIQDHGLLDLNLSTIDTDVYYISLYDQIRSLVEDICDNQNIIKALDCQEELLSIEQIIDKDVAGKITEIFSEKNNVFEVEEVAMAYQNAMKQMALAN